jgi:hypothetical protein
VARKADKADGPGKTGPAAVAEEPWVQRLEADTPGARIARLRRHPEMVGQADALAARYDAAGRRADAWLMADIARASTAALYLDALPLAQSHLKQQQDRSRGGRRTPADAAARHKTWIADARARLATGTERHELAGKMAQRFGVDPGTIRRALRKAGVK